MSRYTSDEMNTIRIMIQQNKTYKEIAVALGRTSANADRGIGNLVRRKGWVKSKDKAVKTSRKVQEIITERKKSMQEMTREERTKHMLEKKANSLRFKKLEQILDPEYVDMFLEEYFDIINATDDINEAEEQMLFEAIKAKILAYIALERDKLQEKLWHATMAGSYTSSDPQYTPALTDKFTKEYSDRNAEYSKLMDKLKMSREKRISEFKKKEDTLVDIVSKMITEENKRSISTDILVWEKKSDEELKRLVENNYLLGDFSE